MKEKKSNPQDFQKNKGEKQEVKTPDEDKEISENIAVETFKDELNNKNKIKEKEKNNGKHLICDKKSEILKRNSEIPFNEDYSLDDDILEEKESQLQPKKIEENISTDNMEIFNYKLGYKENDETIDNSDKLEHIKKVNKIVKEFLDNLINDILKNKELISNLAKIEQNDKDIIIENNDNIKNKPSEVPKNKESNLDDTKLKDQKEQAF